MKPNFRLFFLVLLVAVAVCPPIFAQSGALDAANFALLDGDYDTAAAQFAAAANDPSVKCDALYGLGETLFRADQYDQADAALSRRISECDPATGFEPLILRAQVRQQLSRPADALADYQQAQALKPGLLDSYLYERMAELAPDQSAYYLRLATEAAREPEGKFALREKLAQVYELVGSPDSALAEYDTLLQEIDGYLTIVNGIDGADFDTDGSLRAHIELAAAEIDLQSGREDEAYARLQTIITNYQQSNSALTALIDLIQAGQSVDILARMRINDLNQNYAPMVPVLTDYLSSSANPPAELYLLLGRAQRGTGDPAGALNTFAALRQKYPSDPAAATAVLEQGNTYYQAGDYTQAVTAYSAIPSLYPSAPEAPQGLLDAAQTERDHGDLSRAINFYDQLGTQYPSTDQAQDAMFEAGLLLRASDPTRAAGFFARVGTAEGFLWQGKLLNQAGSADAARQAWQQAANADPGSFFSIRACELIDNRPPLDPQPMIQPDTSSDRAAAQQWVAQTFNIPADSVSAELSPTLASDPTLQRGVELWAVGMWSDARAEFELAAQAAPRRSGVAASACLLLPEHWRLPFVVDGGDSTRLRRQRPDSGRVACGAAARVPTGLQRLDRPALTAERA